MRASTCPTRSLDATPLPAARPICCSAGPHGGAHSCPCATRLVLGLPLLWPRPQRRPISGPDLTSKVRPSAFIVRGALCSLPQTYGRVFTWGMFLVSPDLKSQAASYSCRPSSSSFLLPRGLFLPTPPVHRGGVSQSR